MVRKKLKESGKNEKGINENKERRWERTERKMKRKIFTVCLSDAAKVIIKEEGFKGLYLSIILFFVAFLLPSCLYFLLFFLSHKYGNKFKNEIEMKFEHI